MADDKWYMGFWIGHLHQGERNRIHLEGPSHQEREMLAKGEDPWAKFRGPLPPHIRPPSQGIPPKEGDTKTPEESRNADEFAGRFSDIQPSQVSPQAAAPGEFRDIHPIGTFDTSKDSPPEKSDTSAPEKNSDDTKSGVNVLDIFAAFRHFAKMWTPREDHQPRRPSERNSPHSATPRADLFENLPESNKRTLWDKFWKLTESNLFWGGGVGLASVAYAFKWASAPPPLTITLLVFAWLIISVSIYRHGFFDRWSRTVEAIGNVIISLFIALVFVAIWAILEPSIKIASIVESRPSPSPTVGLPATPSISPVSSPSSSLVPSPRPSPTSQTVRVNPSASPITVPPGYTPAPVTAQLEVVGGSGQNVLEMLRKQADYVGPGTVLQFEVRGLSQTGEQLFFGNKNVNEKTGFGIDDARYWATVDLSDLYFYYSKSGRVVVTFVWLKPVISTQ